MLLTQLHTPEKPLKLTLVGVDCPVELRRSRRARRFSLKVSHTERAAILTLPQEMRVEDAGEFLARHMEWLKRQLDRLPEPVPFENGAVVPLRGISHKVSFVGEVRYQGVVWVEEADALTPVDQWNASTPCKIQQKTNDWNLIDTRA